MGFTHLPYILPHDLISVDEYDLLQILRKENVQEQNLVPPYPPLNRRLRSEPRGPLVADEGHLAVEAL